MWWKQHALVPQFISQLVHVLYIYMSKDANGVMHMLATIGGVKANLRSTVVCRVNNVNLTNGEL